MSSIEEQLSDRYTPITGSKLIKGKKYIIVHDDDKHVGVFVELNKNDNNFGIFTIRGGNPRSGVV